MTLAEIDALIDQARSDEHLGRAARAYFALALAAILCLKEIVKAIRLLSLRD